MMARFARTSIFLPILTSIEASSRAEGLMRVSSNRPWIAPHILLGTGHVNTFRKGWALTNEISDGSATCSRCWKLATILAIAIQLRNDSRIVAVIIDVEMRIGFES